MASVEWETFDKTEPWVVSVVDVEDLLVETAVVLLKAPEIEVKFHDSV